MHSLRFWTGDTPAPGSVVVLFCTTAAVAIAGGVAMGLIAEPMLPGARASEPSVAASATTSEFDDTADERTGTWDDTVRSLANELIARELEAERFVAAEAVDRVAARTASAAPIPVAPREVGLLGTITDARVHGSDRDAFYLGVEANRRAESGSRAPRFSALRTTAGPTHRASYGVAQLTIRDHLFHVTHLGDGELAALRVSRSELESMRRRGEAAGAWYHLLVDRRDVAGASARLRLSAADAQLAQSLAQRGERSELIARFGARFASSLGTSPGAIAEMADTLALRRRDIRDEFRRRYRHGHGVDFDPAHRDLGKMSTTVRAMARDRAAVALLLSRLGGADADAGVGSVAHYLGVGDVGENYYGWYARGASSAVGARRYAEILAAIDPISSRLRELSNFDSALAAVRGVGDLRGIERARMLARIGRCFHGAPGRARDAFFFDDDTSRPRATTAAELEASIQEHRLGRRWSDERVQQAFDDISREREVQ